MILTLIAAAAVVLASGGVVAANWRTADRMSISMLRDDEPEWDDEYWWVAR